MFELIDSAEAANAEVQLSSGVRTLIRVARKWGGEGRVLLLEDVTTVRRLENVPGVVAVNLVGEAKREIQVVAERTRL